MNKSRTLRYEKRVRVLEGEFESGNRTASRGKMEYHGRDLDAHIQALRNQWTRFFRAACKVASVMFSKNDEYAHVYMLHCLRMIQEHQSPLIRGAKVVRFDGFAEILKGFVAEFYWTFYTHPDRKFHLTKRQENLFVKLGIIPGIGEKMSSKAYSWITKKLLF